MKNGDIRPLVVVRSWDSTPLPSTAAAASPTVPVRAGEQVKFPGHNQPQQLPVGYVCGVLYFDPNLDQTNVPIQAPVVVVAPAPGTPTRDPNLAPLVGGPVAAPSPSDAVLHAKVAAGKAAGAQPATIADGVSAQNELDRRSHTPNPGGPTTSFHSPSGGIDFRNRGAATSGPAARPGTIPAGTPTGTLVAGQPGTLSASDVQTLRGQIAEANAPNATADQITAGKAAADTLAKANLSAIQAPVSPQPVLGGPPAPATPGPVGTPTALPPVEGNAFSAWIAAAALDLGKTPGTWHWPIGA